MCEINPKHKKIYNNIIIEFFTSHSNMTKTEFDDLVLRTILEMEMQANKSGIIRCHIHMKDNT